MAAAASTSHHAIYMQSHGQLRATVLSNVTLLFWLGGWFGVAGPVVCVIRIDLLS